MSVLASGTQCMRQALRQPKRPAAAWHCAVRCTHDKLSARKGYATSVLSKLPSSSPRRPHGLCSFARARRRFATTPVPRHGHVDPPKPGEELHLTIIDQAGVAHDYEVAPGANLLDLAQHHGLEMEGACGGSCACSTCHVIVADGAGSDGRDGRDALSFYDRIPEPSDDENDMLDLAFGLTETSRLGCQVEMTPALDGLVVRLPSATRNLQASDFQKNAT